MAEWTSKRWIVVLILSVVIVGLDILMLSILSETLSIACVGIITFMGILLLTNLLSQDPNLSKAEIRRAIAGSSIVVYFTLLSLVSFSKNVTDSDLAKTIVSHFTTIVGIIVIFYFGSRAFEKYKEYTQTGGKPEEEEKP